MIVVYCESGGKGLLGKAREIADSAGERVLALIETESVDPQSLIYLGADEVLKADVESPAEWIAIISDLIEKEKVKLVIFPSNVTSNVIAGAVYSRERGKVGSFLDESDYMEGSIAAKAFEGLSLQKSLGEKVSIVSLKTTSVPEPFDDSSRYGKVRDATNNAPLSFLMEDAPEEPVSSSLELTVIVGNDNFAEHAKKFAEKYRAKFLKYSGAIEAVYGPCVAIEVEEKLRSLPEFRSDLISLNSKASPINAISDVSVVNPEIEKILQRMS